MIDQRIKKFVESQRNPHELMSQSLEIFNLQMQQSDDPHEMICLQPTEAELVVQTLHSMADKVPPLLYADELADALGRGRAFVYSMKKAGFPMPAGTATELEARRWLANNEHFQHFVMSGGAR